MKKVQAANEVSVSVRMRQSEYSHPARHAS